MACLSLTSLVNGGVAITSWAMEENNNTNSDRDNQRPTDDLFNVHLSYHEHGLNDVEVKSMDSSFKLKRESPYWVWQDAVMDFVQDNDVINVDAWDSIIDVVVQNCEELLVDVCERGRKSLVMYVNVHVYHVEEEGGDDEEVLGFEDDEEEPMFLDDIDGEEIIEDRNLDDDDDDDDNEEEENIEARSLEEEEPPYIDDDEEIVEARSLEEEEQPNIIDNDDEAMIEARKEELEFWLEASGVEFYSGAANNKENCSICLEEYDKSDNVAVLPCSHLYHKDCFFGWVFERKGTCPLCRSEFLFLC